MTMDFFVAFPANCDQVRLGIGPAQTPELLMMNFEVRHGSAKLTAPSIPPEHLQAQFFTGFGIEPQPWLSWSNAVHDVFGKSDSRNVCCCASGSSLKNLFSEKSRVSGSPLSRLAPAKKSAQIISKQ